MTYRSIHRSALAGLVAAAALALPAGPAGAFADRAQGASAAAGRPAKAPAPGPRPAAVKPVDINSASKDELKTLPGIGDAEAERIIAARPYPSKAKLLADKVIPAEL